MAKAKSTTKRSGKLVEIDEFANKFYAEATEDVAGTLKFSEINTNIAIGDKIAWVIHRLEWYFSVGILDLIEAAADDCIKVALTSSDKVDDLDLDEPTVIDLLDIQLMDRGTPANFVRVDLPIIRDFSQLPGGGLIVYPKPLFLGVKGISLASVVTVKLRGYFTYRDIDKDTAFDLIDIFRLVQ